jgi:hypothetical protein
MIYELTHDTYSVFRQLYGQAGDKVTLVNAHDAEIWIVQAGDGNRFPINRNGLAPATQVATPKPKPAPEALPIPEITMISKPAARGKKAARPNQNSLF